MAVLLPNSDGLRGSREHCAMGAGRAMGVTRRCDLGRAGATVLCCPASRALAQQGWRVAPRAMADGASRGPCTNGRWRVVAAPCNGGWGYLPFQTGGRFSENARAPSFRSSERSTF